MKKLIDYDRWEKKAEDVTKDLQRDIWRHLERKEYQKQKTKEITQSWDEEKLQNMIGKNRWEC